MWWGGSRFKVGVDVVIPYPYLYQTFGYRKKLKPELIPDQLRYYPSKSGRIPTGTDFLAMSKGERRK